MERLLIWILGMMINTVLFYGLYILMTHSYKYDTDLYVCTSLLIFGWICTTICLTNKRRV